MKRLIKKIKKTPKSNSSSGTREPSQSLIEPVLETVGIVNAQEPSTIPVSSSKGLEVHIKRPEELPNSSTVYEQVSEWLEQGMSVDRDVSEATPILSPLKSASSVMIRGLQLARAIHSNEKAWKELLVDAQVHAYTIGSNIDGLESRIGSVQDPEILRAMKNYSEIIRDILVEAKDAMTRARSEIGPTAEHFAKITVDSQRISSLRSKENTMSEIYKQALSQALVGKTDQISVIVEQIRQDITQNDPTTTALGNSPENEALRFALQYAYGTDLDKCEPGTRVDVLTRIRRWSEDSGSQQVFWLRDAAGTGKSTVAATIAAEWEHSGRLAGRFFFSPNIALNKRIKYFCRTVAADIACRIPELKKLIENKLAESPPMESRMDFAVQLSQTIFGPLAQRAKREPVVLVVDALDNCDIDDRGFFISTVLNQIPAVHQLKLLITSRPLQDLMDVLDCSPLVCGQSVQLLDVNNPPQNDIAVYVHSKLEKYSLEDRQRVIDHSNGLFIWAATFCRTLLQTRLGSRLLSNLTHETVTGSIDELYLNVLEQALLKKSPKESLKQVLQVVISAFQPVSINAIISLLPAVGQVNELVQGLAGVIKDGDPDRPLKVLHPTFREFIASNEERANGFLIHIDPSHSLIGQACLHVLEYSLKFDMLGLSSPGSLIPRNTDIEKLDEMIEGRTSTVVRYASSYWAHHVAASESSWQDWARVARFFRSHLYHWIEFMSWRGMLGSCLQALSRLNNMVREDADSIDAEVRGDRLFVQHAFQLVLRNQSVIQEAALHAYTIPAALVPRDSPLSQVVRTSSNSPLLKAVTAIPIVWEAQRRLSWEEDDINIVKVSPDGTRVVTVGMSAAVQLWDLETGEVVGNPIGAAYQYQTVLDAEFSSDSRYLAIALMAGDLVLWEARTGRQIWLTKAAWDLRTHGPHRTVRFSPTRPYIALAAGRRDGMVITESYTRLYDVATGRLHDDFLTFEPPSTFFEFSPDGDRSVYVGEFDDERQSEGSFITVVDMVNLEQLVQIATSVKIYLPGISYSTDSTRVVVISRFPDQHVAMTLLDGRTGDKVTMSDIDESPTQAAVFIPHSPYMITNPHGTPTIILWDSRSGRKLWSVSGDCDYLRGVWVSTDGQKIAALSNDQKIKVWDVATRKELPSLLEGYTGVVGWQVVLTPDWSRLLNQMGYRELRLFNLNGQAEGLPAPEPPRSRGGQGILLSNTSSLIFSPESRKNRGINIWNSVGETPQRTTLVEPGRVDVADFKVTPDENVLVYTRSNGGAIFVSIPSGLEMSKCLQDEDPATFGGRITLSRDGSAIAISDSRCTQVWDYHTGRTLWKTTEIGVNHKFALSADGKAIAVYGADTLVFNLMDNEEIGSINGRLSVWALDIQPAGDLLAVSSCVNLGMFDDRTLELWNWRQRDKKPIARIKMPHDAWEGRDRPYFSSDGNYIVINSLVWAVEGGALTRVISDTIPPSLRDYPSFLTHSKGWIHSAFPPGPVLPLPAHFKAILDEKWSGRELITRKNVIVLLDDWDTPTWIDLSAFVGSFDE